MAKILSDKELIEWLKGKREVLRNHRCVDCGDLMAHSKLYAPSDSKGESDICIDQTGSAILEDIRKRFYQYEDSYYEERLLSLWGQEPIDSKLYSFIRKNKFIRNIPHDLLRPKRHKWTVYLGLSNIHLKAKTDVKVAVLHPPGIPNVKGLSKKIRSGMEEVNQHVFIEIKNIEAPTLFYAGIKAIEQARTYLALIPNQYASLSHRDDIRFSGHAIGFNRNTREWFREWQIPHKGLVINDYEKKVLEGMGTLLKQQAKKKSGVSKRILDIAEMFFAAKTSQYSPAKLLLLATVLESLLLEETFNQTTEYKKINQKAQIQDRPDLKVKKGVYFHRRLDGFISKHFDMKKKGASAALKFLNELYDKRSEVTHLCEKHNLSDAQVQIVENLCLVLMEKICKAGGRTHLTSIRKVCGISSKV